MGSFAMNASPAAVIKGATTNATPKNSPVGMHGLAIRAPDITARR